MKIPASRLVDQLKEKGIKNQRVLDAIESTHRDQFVSTTDQIHAYKDRPLAIDCGQTISQPYIVARMTELLIEKNPQTILEIGTGSGYQTAILAQLIPKIYSIERIETLLEQAKQRLTQLKFTHIQFKCADGSSGWADYAPFDAIIVTAVAPHAPKALLSQLNVNGRLVIPIGHADEQFLYVIDRTADNYQLTRLDPVRFVPLVEDDFHNENSNL